MAEILSFSTPTEASEQNDRAAALFPVTLAELDRLAARIHTNRQRYHTLSVLLERAQAMGVPADGPIMDALCAREDV